MLTFAFMLCLNYFINHSLISTNLEVLFLLCFKSVCIKFHEILFCIISFAKSISTRKNSNFVSCIFFIFYSLFTASITFASESVNILSFLLKLILFDINVKIKALEMMVMCSTGEKRLTFMNLHVVEG